VRDWLSDQVADGPLTYLVLIAACATDVLLPLIPSETMVVTAGVLSADGGLALWLVVLASATGAFLGDHVAYLLGRAVGDPAAERLFRSERGRARLAWAERAIRSHGTALIVLGRFLPGGRSVTTFAAGTLELPYRRFAPADALAALVWASYVALLGYVGGETFSEQAWPALLGAFGVAALVAACVELWRRLQRRRGRDLLGDELPADELR
jgi:membrane-associated protein